VGAGSSATSKKQKPETKTYASMLSGPTLYPPLGGSLARSIAALTQPQLLIGVLLIVPILWFILRLVGLQTFPLGIGSMTDILAIPPVSSSFDMTQAGNIFGLNGSAAIAFLFAATLVRSLIIAVFAGLLDEQLEYGKIGKVGFLRGLRAVPPVAAATIFAVCTILVTKLLFAQFLGQGFGGLLFLLGQIAVIFFLGFVPASAVRGPAGVRGTFDRSVRGARLQGWPRHLLMAVAYYFFAVVGVQLIAFSVPGALWVTSNPSVAVWITVLAVSLAHVAFLGAFVDRYRLIEGAIPDEPVRRARGGASKPPAPRSRR
jgi:hypothetical protein